MSGRMQSRGVKLSRHHEHRAISSESTKEQKKERIEYNQSTGRSNLVNMTYE